MASLNVLEFEKKMAELDENLVKLHQAVADRTSDENASDGARQIEEMERTRTQLFQNFFENLTAWDNVLLARHPKRPYTLDYIQALCDDFQELHGDRMGYDDGAIVSGLARFEGRAIAVIGHQKGRDLKQRQQRNFGSARPEGYRKAMRIMALAAKFGLPILTLVDTAAAAADVAADERGISEAIARSLFTMATLPVPIVSVVIGEGGSGGAIALALADRVLMLEHAIYSVIPPEGCAAILFRDPERKQDAARSLNLTAQGARSLGIIDAIVPEPLGGAHHDWAAAAEFLQKAICQSFESLVGSPPEALIAARYAKFRRLGEWTELAEPVQEAGILEEIA